MRAHHLKFLEQHHLPMTIVTKQIDETRRAMEQLGLDWVNNKNQVIWPAFHGAASLHTPILVLEEPGNWDSALVTEFYQIAAPLSPNGFWAIYHIKGGCLCKIQGQGVAVSNKTCVCPIRDLMTNGHNSGCPEKRS